MLRKKNWELANYLLKKGARPNCMLRWQFVVRNQALSPSEILNFMEVNNISPVLKSDDGLNYTIFHYLCLFGNVEEVERLLRGPDAQSLANDPTDSNDIALTIALLSPRTSVETRTLIASRPYPHSNVSLCNRSSQSPLHLTLLLGKIDLLIHMLPFATNTRFDSFRNSILHLAIKARLTSVAWFIIGYVNFNEWNSEDSTGDSVFTLAIKMGYEDLACELLNCGCNPDVSGVDWQKKGCERDLSIHQAIKRGMPTLANQIFKQGGYELKFDSEGNLPIHLALLYHLNDCIDFLLSDSTVSTFISVPNRAEQNSPLHLAIELGLADYARKILDAGADINAVNKLGFTPIHSLIRAACGESKQAIAPDDITQLLIALLQHNPKLSIQCKPGKGTPGETALHMAIRGGLQTEHLAELLLQADPSLVNERDQESSTPLLRAVEQHSLKLVQALCEAQAELDVVNRDRDTPLHIAVRNGDVAIVEYLVNRGAYLRLWNKDGFYPMHLAIQLNNLEIVSLLCIYDVDANLCTRDGDSPFLLACSVGGLRVANFLLDRRADPFLFSRSEKSCISIVADLVRAANGDSQYAELARLVNSCAPTLARDCFPNADLIRRDSQFLDDYVNQAIAKGLISPTSTLSSSSLPFQRASTLQRVSSFHASSLPRETSGGFATLGARKKSRLPPPPPTSEPPVETLRSSPSRVSTLVQQQQQ